MKLFGTPLKMGNKNRMKLQPFLLFICKPYFIDFHDQSKFQELNSEGKVRLEFIPSASTVNSE